MKSIANAEVLEFCLSVFVRATVHRACPSLQEKLRVVEHIIELQWSRPAATNEVFAQKVLIADSDSITQRFELDVEHVVKKVGSPGVRGGITTGPGWRPVHDERACRRYEEQQ